MIAIVNVRRGTLASSERRIVLAPEDGEHEHGEGDPCDVEVHVILRPLPVGEVVVYPGEQSSRDRKSDDRADLKEDLQQTSSDTGS